MDEKAHTGKLLKVLFFVAATAVFLFSVQASSLAQRSCLAPSRGDAARAMSVSEEARVRRALEEVREDSGREVFVCHLMYIGRDQCVDYLGQRQSFGAEDAVIQVSNAERTMTLVQAPGLPEAQTLRLSESMTAEFRRDGYAAALIHGARDLEDRLPDTGTGHRDLEDLFEDRLREVRGEGRASTAPDPGDSGLAIGLVCAGTAAVLLFLFLFLRNERYRRPDEPEKTAAFYQARRTAEESVAALAPKMLLLAEREEAVASLLSEAGGEDCREAGCLGQEATGFWKRFSDASALIESDPEKALDELRLLPPLVEAALKEQEEAARALTGEDEHRESLTEGESDARARRR